MKYFLGGYYLIVLKPLSFGTTTGEIVYTCSDCINENLVDGWSYSWITGNGEETVKAKEKFKLSDEDISAIRTWVDKKAIENKLGWLNVFTDLETALEYKQDFFPDLQDVKVMAVYFDEDQAKQVIEKFKPESDQMGEIGIRLALLRKKEESENKMEKLLGFDFIGIEISGDFHSFHCHDLGAELEKEFDQKVNEFGLIEYARNFEEVIDYLNVEENGFEPVPWYSVKMKLVSTDAGGY